MWKVFQLPEKQETFCDGVSNIRILTATLPVRISCYIFSAYFSAVSLKLSLDI